MDGVAVTSSIAVDSMREIRERKEGRSDSLTYNGRECDRCLGMAD